MVFHSLRGNPLDWPPKARCLLVAVLALPFVVWYALVEGYLLLNPAAAPYVSHSVLRIAFRIQLGLVGAWTLLVVAALALPIRSAGASRVLAHVTAQLYVLTVLQFSYFTGFYTSLFPGVTFIAGAAVGFVLFERSVVMPAIALFVLFPLATTIAEWADLIPYAPLFNRAPFADGVLAVSVKWWKRSEAIIQHG